MLASSVPERTGQRCAPSRMVPPRPELWSRFSTLPLRSVHSVMSAMTGCGVSSANSVLLASVRPATWRAYSTTASCMPRQMPRNGTLFSRANWIARILPSTPRLPKPPGTRMAS